MSFRVSAVITDALLSDELRLRPYELSAVDRLCLSMSGECKVPSAIILDVLLLAVMVR